MCTRAGCAPPQGHDGGRVRGRDPQVRRPLRTLYERARRKEDLGLGNDLALRAAAVYEHSLGDLNAAEAQYKARA